MTLNKQPVLWKAAVYVLYSFSFTYCCSRKSSWALAKLQHRLPRSHPRSERAAALYLITRANQAVYDAVRVVLPLALYHPDAGLISLRQQDVSRGKGIVLVVAAGTADLPVAEEAALTADLMGNDIERLYDVGVAGLHRLLGERDQLGRARVIIVVAGMEGALPSVVSGLVGVPVIAVPTSVGYGASFGGVAALLGMLNSCASGVVVVNIDNGFGAASVASLINHL